MVIDPCLGYQKLVALFFWLLFLLWLIWSLAKEIWFCAASSGTSMLQAAMNNEVVKTCAGLRPIFWFCKFFPIGELMALKRTFTYFPIPCLCFDHLFCKFELKPLKQSFIKLTSLDVFGHIMGRKCLLHALGDSAQSLNVVATYRYVITPTMLSMPKFLQDMRQLKQDRGLKQRK